MFGVLLLLGYLVLGTVLAGLFLQKESLLLRLWAGGVLGLALLMWSNVPFSFLWGFSVASHLAGLALTVLLTVVLCGLRLRKTAFPEAGESLTARLFGTGPIRLTREEGVLLSLVVPLMIFSSICLWNHTLNPVGGAYYTGQCTYGDMNFHLGIITSLKEQGTFPPEYSICPGEQLDYYFLCDSVSSSLYLFGLGLRASYILPMFLGFLLVFLGFWFFARAVLRSGKRANLAFLLFFLNGGFGLFYFLDNLRNDKTNFTQIFTEYYHTPTNYVNDASIGRMTNIRWTNAIVDMMLPQRATLFGWMVLFLTLYLLYRAVFEGKNAFFPIAGILAGLTPMIQTYTYFTIGLVAIAWIVYSCIRDRFGKTILVSWLRFGVPAVVLSVPQLYLWVFGAVDGQSFVQVAFNAYNESDNWLWFWVKNVGVVFLLLLPAFLNASRRMKCFYGAGLLIFVVTELVRFQTFSYDNNKLYLMWYAFSAILVADFLAVCYRKLEGVRGRAVLAALLLVLCTASALLTMGRELYSGMKGNAYELYCREEVQAAEFIRTQTEPDALFLSHNNHNNVIASLAGRNIFVGSGVFLASHDVDYGPRAQALSSIFRDRAVFEQYRAEYGFDYVFISGQERRNYGGSGEFLESYLRETYPVCYERDGVVIFDVRGDAV